MKFPEVVRNIGSNTGYNLLSFQNYNHRKKI